MKLRQLILASLGTVILGLGTGAQAQIRQNEGFRRNAIAANDDGSSPLTPIGWTLNFFGRQRSNVYVNNNGNITFDAPMPGYTPFGLTGVDREIIAPFFADVDTRPEGSSLVTYGQDFVNGRRAFGVNYVNVGYYNTHADKLNSFQLVLIERPDTGNGNFDIEFNYERVTWETGDASGGVAGFGGVPASVGWSNGSGLPGTSFELAGSLIPGSFLDSGAYSLVAGRTPGVSPGANAPQGRWMFRARDGQLIPPIEIRSGCPLPTATAGRLYSFRLEAAGSKPPYRWTAQADQGSLPGLQLNSSGLLTGVPPAPGEYEFTVRVTASDEDGDVSISRRCSVIVDSPAIFISSAGTLPQAVAGQRYETRLRADGSTSPIRFALYESTGVPGLTLASDGTLSGTSPEPGTYQIQVRAASSGVDRAVASIKRFVLTVRPGGLSILSACPLPTGTGGASYSYQFEADGGAPPYRWSNWGTLPTGTFLSSTGKLSGQPSVPHWWPFDVIVEDARGNTARSGCGLVVRFPDVHVASACPLPAASTGIAYSQRLEATGGTGGYIWTAEGTLPSGLSLTRDGLLSGTPLGAGSSQFRLNATDTDGNTGSVSCSVITQRGAYAVATCPLPDAFAGEPYSTQLTAAGGLAPFSWSPTSALPAALRFGRDGLLSGTFNNAGTYPLSVQVTDSTGQTASRTCDLRVLPRTLRLVNPCDLAVATAGEPYTQRLSAAGGLEPYTFTAVSLPSGVLLRPDGSFEGAASRAGVFPVSYQVKDAAGSSSAVSCKLTVRVPNPPEVQISGMPRILQPASNGPELTFQLSRAYPLDLEADATLEVTPDTNNGQAGVDRADPSVLLTNGQKTIPLSFAPGSRSASVRIAGTGTVASTVRVSMSKLRVPGTSIEFPKQPAPATGVLSRAVPSVTSVCYTANDDGLEIDITGFSTTRELSQADLTFGSNRYQVSLSRASLDYFGGDDSVRTGGAFRIRAPYRARTLNAKSLGDGTVVILNKVGASTSRAIRRCN